MNEVPLKNIEYCLRENITMKEDPTEKLFHNLSDYCNGFFHVERSVEAGVAETCLCSTQCYRKSVTCIVKLAERTGEELYSAKYTNNRNFSGTIHAEQFIYHDETLNALVNTLAKDKDYDMIVYMTYQPCHYSGGHTKKSNMSCTELMINYNRQMLVPNNIQLHLKTAYIYRAHWSRFNIERKYWPMIDSSVMGIRKLHDNNIKLSNLQKNDWNYIHSLVSDDVLAQVYTMKNYDKLLEERVRMDTFIGRFYSQYITFPDRDLDLGLCLDFDPPLFQETHEDPRQQPLSLHRDMHLKRLSVV